MINFIHLVFHYLESPGGHCYHTPVFKHPEAAPSIVRDGKSTAFVESRFCFFLVFVSSVCAVSLDP